MAADNKIFISRQALQRLPLYLNYLHSLYPDYPSTISARAIADALGLHHVLVRKDLAAVSHGGRPRTGYATSKLAADIKFFLGHNNMNSAVLAGAGNLGTALLNYNGFSEYGLKIVAAFDQIPATAGRACNGKPVYPMEMLGEVCAKRRIRIGIVTVPAHSAQQVCDIMVACGILAIWNFAPIHLRVPSNVITLNENMAASLAVLCKHLLRSAKAMPEREKPAPWLMNQAFEKRGAI